MSALKIPVIILAGGKGTRLEPVDSTRPKPMVLVLEKPFLYWLIKNHVKQGIEQFILSTCHLAEQIENYPWAKEFQGIEFRFYREPQALGTGGAVVAVFKHFQDLKTAWIINGDTLLSQPLSSADLNPGEDAFYTVLNQSEVFDAVPNLVFESTNNSHATRDSKKRYFDAGATLVTRRAVESYQGAIPCDFHKVLEIPMKQGKVGFRLLHGTCYDIGTPERLKRFEKYLSQVK